VKAFAKLYNYRPNNIALSLKNRKTKNIGVIIPDIVHHYFTKVINGIEEIALKRGYNVIVGLSNESFDKEALNMEMLANGSIDGFILSVAKETLMQEDFHHFKEILEEGMPIVMFDRIVDEINCDKVVVDDLTGAKKAVEKLIKAGCKNIAIITTKDYINVGRLRTRGYLEALHEHGIELKSNLVLKVDDKFITEQFLDNIEDEVELLFENNSTIDGVFAVNELYAITAMKVARKFGKRIPEDVQIIGFTDGVLSKHAFPGLTTISQHGDLVGKKAAELLIDKLENEDNEERFQTLVIETELVERESTKNN
ncbi:MAG: LacI family DNA-binding transcriptional regulator, partial [Bacteroidia bacterium]|nr:LacI family DNA-binding transcriptional regulator [Bacteroidia bacterium]